ncbi:MAG: HAMP domain-containing sensor histidine kinase [Alphaproteobacteria bacterium]
MLSEVFIYAPSVGRFRLVYLQERVAAAHLASLALEVPPDNMVSAQLRAKLLDHAGAYGIVLHRPASKALMLSADMPPKIDAIYDLRHAGFFGLIGQAFAVLAGDGERVLRVIGVSPKAPDVVVEAVIAEAPLRAAMLDYSWRILALSIVISLTTAVLVFISLHWLFVRPMHGLMAAMISFREDPEDARRLVTPGERTDELGIAERELAGMQRGLRSALTQKTRLAALGTAVTKINHDLRNILATAQLVSDHVELSDDPKVKRIAPTLMGAIDRAVTLCERTLGFVLEGAEELELTQFPLRVLVDEVAASAVAMGDSEVVLDNRVDPAIVLHADRDQMFRVLFNLIRNAFEAGASKVTISGMETDGHALIDVVDDGPGLPARVRGSLFQPFSGSTRSGGTGLGLSIARDLMRGHGGDIELVRSDQDGTLFRLSLLVGMDDRESHTVNSALHD